MPCSPSAPRWSAWSAYHDGRTDWAEAEVLALKHMLGVAETEEQALIAEMAAVLSDAEIDALLEALASMPCDRRR